MPHHNRRAPRITEIGQGKRIAAREIDSDPHEGKILLPNTVLALWRRKDKALEWETEHHSGMWDQKDPGKLAEENQPSPEGRTAGNEGHSGGEQIHVPCPRTTDRKDQKRKGNLGKIVEPSDQADKGEDGDAVIRYWEKGEQPTSRQHEQKRESFILVG